MNQFARRLLLFVSAALLAGGAVLHSQAFRHLGPVLSDSHLPEFYGKAFKALWWIDSVALMGVAIHFTAAALHPAITSGTFLALVALIPLATAIVLYVFMGSFVPAHLCLLASALAIFAGLMRE
jgi:hypothetical protein